jgi:alanine racemase
MNMITVNVTHGDPVLAGDTVVMIGSQDGAVLSAEDLASQIGTINYEIVTAISPLLPRILVD